MCLKAPLSVFDPVQNKHEFKSQMTMTMFRKTGPNRYFRIYICTLYTYIMEAINSVNFFSIRFLDFAEIFRIRPCVIKLIVCRNRSILFWYTS